MMPRSAIKMGSALRKPLWLVLLALFLLGAVTSCPINRPVLSVELVASGFNQPVFIGSARGDSTRLYVLERSTAMIALIKNGTTAAEPFLDLSDKAGAAGDEQGLLGMAFHPDYPSQPFVFVDYTDQNGATIVERYTVAEDLDHAQKETAKLIIQIDQPTSFHHAGMLAFSPVDDYLYVSTGDGGPGNDPDNNGQRLDTLLGKILRLDIDTGDSTPYAIPPDNPFAGDDAALDEIWAYGLRNPWRFSFDSLTGDLYIGDVGQAAREEIDFQSASSSGGENYGWKIAEGFACRGGAGTCGTDPGLTAPIHDYDHSEGHASVTGGYVYRGTNIRGLQGTYFFADFIQGRIWSLRYDGFRLTGYTERTSELDPPGPGSLGYISSFGEGGDGELYVVDYAAGAIYRIVSAS